MERQVSSYYRSKAELQGEKEELIQEIEGLHVRVQEEATAHCKVITELQKRLQTVEQSPDA